MNYCKRCVQPDTRPGQRFNEKGLCGACAWEEEKEKIDWEERRKELQEIADWAKKTAQGHYNCVIGISGGKDSLFQALTAKDKLGLRPLLVNSEPDGITDIGRKNIENLIKLGFDTIKLRPNPTVVKKLVKRDFYKYLNPVKILEYPLWASAFIIADKFNIPLIIQGENAALTEGIVDGDLDPDGNALNANKHRTVSSGIEEYFDTVNEEDLFMFHYDREEMFRKGFKGAWLQYYVKDWSMTNNANFALARGLSVLPENFDPNEYGTYSRVNQLDTNIVQVNQMLKYIKLGFGQCTDHASYDIRSGLLSRDEAIELVRKYDGKCGERFIKAFCDYIEIGADEFWRVANSFRGPMWERKNGEWILKDPIWEQKSTVAPNKSKYKQDFYD